MRAHLEYLKNLLRHKWFVFVACCKLGIPWRGIMHDLSKFSRAEWSPYVHTFYDTDGLKRPKIRDSSGAYDPTAVSPEFRLAWLYHQRNKHHWQAWIAIGDRGSLAILPMPEVYIKEMVADWMGAGKTHGGSSPQAWYAANKGKLLLNDATHGALLDLLEAL